MEREFPEGSTPSREDLGFDVVDGAKWLLSVCDGLAGESLHKDLRLVVMS